jgi:hypothetical protein
VKLVLSAPAKKPELLNVPHTYALPVLKLHCPNVNESDESQREHWGNVDGGDGMVSVVSVRIVSTLVPSKLYSFVHASFCSKRIIRTKTKKKKQYRFKCFIVRAIRRAVKQMHVLPFSDIFYPLD